MNRDKIFDMFNGVSDDYVLDAIESRKAVPNIKNHTKNIFLIAAAIGMAAILVGCGIIYMLKMQDLKLGNRQTTESRWDEEHKIMISETVSQQVLTFSGIKGSANYKAAQEWMEFEEQFDPDYAVAREVYLNPLVLPEEYDAYSIYTQEQADKLVEIASKYGLNLAGPEIIARSPKSLLVYLNIDSLLLPNAHARMSNLVTEFYENGKFYANFYLLMDSNDNNWPYDTFCLFYYTPKTCFDNHFVYLSENAVWREWNYTTASGEQVLILRSDSHNEAYIFSDQDSATAYVKIYTEAFNELMSDQQLEQMVDQINFSINPQPGNPAILNGFGNGINPGEKKQTHNGYSLEVKSVTTDGEIAYITLGVTAPEGISLVGKGIHPQNRHEGLMLPYEGNGNYPNLNVNWVSVDDSDGLENTQNLIIIAEPNTMDGAAFRLDSIWNIYIEGIDISESDSLLQMDVQQQVDGIWQFDVSFEQGDFREVEFIKTPVEMNLFVGGGKRADVQLISLKLRRYSATAIFADGAGDLNDYEGESTCVVLTDGRKIEMHHTGGHGNVTGFRFEGEIPLDEVEYVILKDGTKLYPQS